VVGLFGIDVAAGRISKMPGQVRLHGLRDAGVDRCGGVVVEIDGSVGQPWVMAGYAKVVHARPSWLPGRSDFSITATATRPCRSVGMSLRISAITSSENSG
jgi:hypothetical protein